MICSVHIVTVYLPYMTLEPYPRTDVFKHKRTRWCTRTPTRLDICVELNPCLITFVFGQVSVITFISTLRTLPKSLLVVLVYVKLFSTNRREVL